jgi:hypothetical protein
VSLVAINQSGIASVPHVIGPFKPVDPTPPSLPTFCVGGSSSTMTLTPSRLSVDAESGVAGYEYRIRTADSVVQDWSGTLVKFQIGVPVQIGGSALPTKQYWVEVRAVNTQGGRSGIVSSGPLQ